MPSNLARLIVLLAALSGLAAPPVAAQSADQWFLAEGASNAVLEEEILIANPSSSSVTVTVTRRFSIRKSDMGCASPRYRHERPTT